MVNIAWFIAFASSEWSKEPNPFQHNALACPISTALESLGVLMQFDNCSEELPVLHHLHIMIPLLQLQNSVIDDW